MRPSEHVLYGGLASAALYPAIGAQAGFFFAGSVLIDVDHYIDFLYYSRFRDWHPRAMFRFHGHLFSLKEKRELLALEAFHTAEFLAGFLLVGLWMRSQPLLLIFAGMVFHLALDLIRLRQYGKVRIRALSFLEYWLRSRRWLHQRGEHPERAFWEAYSAIQNLDFDRRQKDFVK